MIPMVFDAKEIEQIIDKPIFPEGLKGGADVLIIDPPWDVQQTGNFGAIKHYSLMTLEQIQKMPVADLLADNAAVWLWCTAATIPDAYRILEGWGLTPRAPFVWIKNRMGLGQYLRNYCEFLILGTKGKMLPAIKNQPNIGLFPLQDHSHKPEEIHTIIMRMYPNAKYLELFARRRQHGWYAWGNECPDGSDVVLPCYPVLEYSEAVKPEIEKFLKESKGAKC